MRDGRAGLQMCRIEKPLGGPPLICSVAGGGTQTQKHLTSAGEVWLNVRPDMPLLV